MSAVTSPMAMAASPPSSPEGMRNVRPQSMYTASSPEHAQRRRPQSMMMRPPRSTSRLSMASSKGGATRLSDEEGKTAVKVGE